MIPCVSHRVNYESKLDTFTVVPIGDIHLGNEACDEKRLAETVKRIQDDDHCYWVGLGDYCEWINRQDKRHDPESEPSWLWGHGDIAKVQRERIIEILSPIAGDKCLGLIEGNHERTILQYSERDVYTTIAEALGTRCLGPLGFVRLTFERLKNDRQLFIIMATHGWWGGRLMGAGALNLERLVGWSNADIVMAGHDHKRRAFPLTRLVALKNDTVEQRDTWAISTGSYLDGARYAQMKGYRPLPVGSPEAIITPYQRRIQVLQ